MNLELFTEPASRLGWAVIHSFWQGAFIAALLATALALLRRRSAAVRYGACLLALAAMIAGFGGTLLRSGAQREPVPSRPAPSAPGPRALAVATPTLEEPASEIAPALSSLETVRVSPEPAP